MFDTSLVSEIQAHAIEEYPNEACGLIVDGLYWPQPNIADDPTKAFRMNPQAWVDAALTGTIEAVVHSHPDGPDCPSAADMERQVSSGVPWIIVSCNGEGALEPFSFGPPNDAPLIGRGFRHGVTDCYGLIRDYYATHRNVILPAGPRDWEWWAKDGDLYRENFPSAGFTQIDEADIMPGDLFLAQVRSDVPNHGGVYLGDGIGLHHLTARLPVDPTRLSRREPIMRWRKFITHWLRYIG